MSHVHSLSALSEVLVGEQFVFRNAFADAIHEAFYRLLLSVLSTTRTKQSGGRETT